jgi:hypothetical protein
MDESNERVVADCRKFPSEKNCTVTIAGSRAEVLPLATYHAIKDHGHEDTPEFRKEVEGMLEPEVSTAS